MLVSSFLHPGPDPAPTPQDIWGRSRSRCISQVPVVEEHEKSTGSPRPGEPGEALRVGFAPGKSPGVAGSSDAPQGP